MRGATLLAALALVAGCAGPPDDQEIRVATTPEGGACGFHRAGEPVGLVSRAPGPIFLPPGIAPLRAACRIDGHYPTAAVIRPPEGADALGRLRAEREGQGGIEAAASLARPYPAELAFELRPIEPALLTPLPLEQVERIETLRAEAALRLRALRDDCRTAPYGGCGLAIAELERERDRELAALDPTFALVQPPR